MKSPLATLAAAIALASGSDAQDSRGEILGAVKDPSGAAVSGARVKAANPTGDFASTTTGRAGDFRLTFLSPGPWQLSVAIDGFRGFREDNVLVRGGESTTVDVALQVGPSTETVHVTARAPLLNLADPSAGIVIEAEDFQELPLRDGNPLTLAFLAPGVANLAEGAVRPYDNENASAMAINGSDAGSHEFKVDGAANTAGASGNVAHVPPANVVSEFKVETSPFDARNGFSSGGAISLNLRPGGAKVRGQAYWYFENPVTNANSFFSNKSGSGKDNFRENRAGFTASGPLNIPRLYRSRNRTFFIYAYDAIHASQPYRQSNLTFTAPTAAERQGNLSDLLPFGTSYQIYDPKSTRPSTTAGRFTRDPFPGNLIPANRLSPAAQNLIGRYYPMPNLPATKPTGVNYTMPSLQVNRFHNQLARVDHVLAEKHRLFLRGNWSARSQDLECRFNDGAGVEGRRGNLGFGFDEVFILSTRSLLDFRYNYTRYLDNMAPPSTGTDLAALGFSPAFVNQVSAIDARNLMLPDIAPAGYPELNGYQITRLSSDIHAGAIDLTRVARTHALHIGGEHRVYRDASGNTGRSSGKINFNTNWTKGPLDNAAASPIGQGLAGFLLGLPTDGGMDLNPSLAQQYQASGWYAQDTWKARPRLTVNLGLRWEFEVPVTERYNRSIRGFDYSAPSPIAAQAGANYTRTPSALLPAANFQVAGGLTFAGQNGQPRQLWSAGHRNFAPRAGIALLARKNLVLRAGYGMFFDVARQTAIQTGFSRTTTLVASQDTGRTYLATLENPFPNGFEQPAGSSLGLMTNVGQSITVFPNRLLNPYQQRWEAAVQRSLGPAAVFEVAYVGARGTHLRAWRQLDPVPARYLSVSPVRDNARHNLLTANLANPFYPLLPNTSLAGSTVPVAQLLRPYPQFTGINGLTNGGFSWYHSLQSRVQKRFRKNYQTIVSYTWSKFMDATGFLNEADARPSRAISTSDRAHRLVATGIYQAPFGKGRRGLAAAMLSGWQLQAIYQRQSGAPLPFGNVLWYGGVPLAGARVPERWFNTSNFERNTAAQLVYNLRTFPLRISNVRSMGLNMLDAGVSKSQRLGERATLQLRADAFNAMNHTHFGMPNTTPTGTDFGVVTTTAQQPRIVEFSLRVSF